MISESLKEWNGTPIKLYKSSEALECPDVIYKIAYSWDNESAGGFQELFPQYLADEKSKESVGLSLGLDGDMADGFYTDTVQTLLKHKDQFPKLKWLFLGDMVGEECELTWIEQGDVGAPVIDSFPQLEVLYARGGEGSMEFSKASHPKLKKLVLQPGAMTKEMLDGLLASEFPELEELELWLGDDERGGDLTTDDVRELLMGNPFPKLKKLGLMNSGIVNEIAKDIGSSAIIDQIEELDLSMGTLQDDGALALLASDKVKSLKSLNLRHHYISSPIMDQFKDLSVSVDVSEQQSPDDWDGELHYYIAISE